MGDPKTWRHTFPVYHLAFSIETNCDELYPCVRKFFGHFAPLATPASEELVALKVLRDEEGYDFYRDEEHLHRGRAWPEMLLILDFFVLNYFRNNSSRYAVLHAGMVVRNGSGIMLPGATGVGKSTLTAWLVRQGSGYLGDEHVVLDPSGPTLKAFPRPIALRAEAYRRLVEADPALRDMGFPLPVMERRDIFIDPDDLRQGSVQFDGTVKYILFPRVSLEEEPFLIPVSKADAVMRLVRGYMHFHSHRFAAIERLSELVEHASSFALATGDLKKTTAVIDDLVLS